MCVCCVHAVGSDALVTFSLITPNFYHSEAWGVATPVPESAWESSECARACLTFRFPLLRFGVETTHSL